MATHNLKAIKRVDPSSLGKYVAGVYILIAIIMGVVMIVVGLIELLVSHNAQVLAIGIGVSTIAAALYGAFGYLIGLLGAAIYNVVSSKTGGVKIVIE